MGCVWAYREEAPRKSFRRQEARGAQWTRLHEPDFRQATWGWHEPRVEPSNPSDNLAKGLVDLRILKVESCTLQLPWHSPSAGKEKLLGHLPQD
jgi:hypothetical protein